MPRLAARKFQETLRGREPDPLSRPGERDVEVLGGRKVLDGAKTEWSVAEVFDVGRTGVDMRAHASSEWTVEDPRIRRAAPYTRRLLVHEFRISAPEQLDEELAGWVREAYQVGQGEHLARPPRSWWFGS